MSPLITWRKLILFMFSFIHSSSVTTSVKNGWIRSLSQERSWDRLRIHPIVTKVVTEDEWIRCVQDGNRPCSVVMGNWHMRHRLYIHTFPRGIVSLFLPHSVESIQISHEIGAVGVLVTVHGSRSQMVCILSCHIHKPKKTWSLIFQHTHESHCKLSVFCALWLARWANTVNLSLD